jgi:hypothetical protein
LLPGGYSSIVCASEVFLMNRQVTTCLAVFALAGFGSGCGGTPQSTGSNGGNGPDSGGGNTGAGSGGGGGSSNQGSGGNGSSGSGGAIQGNGGFDDGNLFADAAPPAAPADASMPSGGDASVPSDASGQASGVAVKMFPSLGINLSFTQNGTDVKMVATHKGCGAMMVQIHDGFSCDNTSTQGGVWDGKRGDGIAGPVTCDASQTGTLTYTRPGNDPTLNWTVGDHNAKTDVTYHPIFVDGHCLTFF